MSTMNRRSKIILGSAVALATVGGAGVAIGTSQGDDDSTERSITGAALQKASAAALDHTGGGRVTDTEVGDEESYYEVEVTKPDGSQIDVQLDRSFKVVGSEGDSESEDEGSGDD
jgi:uncharacterized membrane protein YkoI